MCGTNGKKMYFCSLIYALNVLARCIEASRFWWDLSLSVCYEINEWKISDFSRKSAIIFDILIIRYSNQFEYFCNWWCCYISSSLDTGTNDARRWEFYLCHFDGRMWFNQCVSERLFAHDNERPWIACNCRLDLQFDCVTSFCFSNGESNA